MAGAMKFLVRNWVISLLLYGSLAIHVLFSFWRIYKRRTLKLTASEWLQLGMGLAIPYFLISHVVGTRYASAAYGLNDTYAYVLLSVFVFVPNFAIYNALGLIAAWLHGCIGMHMWFKNMSWYSARLRTVLLAMATLLPTLSLTGYLAAGQRMIPRASDAEFMERYNARLNLQSDEVWQWLAADVWRTEVGFIVLVALVVIGRLARGLFQNRSKTITIDYIDGPDVKLPVGASLLELSKLGQVPHANVCGGKGRCSTCRVRLINPPDDITPPDEAEQRVLQRVRASNDVRLACQFYPQSDVKVLRLLPYELDQSNASDFEPWSSS